MIKLLFESGAVYAVVASIAGLGLIFRIMELMAFRSMVSQKDKKEKSNGKRPSTFLTFLKTDYTKKYLTGKKVNNVDAFVDKHMMNREFCGLNISTYRKICGIISVLTVSSTILFSIWGKLYFREQNEILSTFFVGIISTTLLIIVDNLIDYENRIKKYRTGFVSYIENEYSYYISTDEGVQKAAIQTLASRQKKILMEEKENDRKSLIKDADENSYETRVSQESELEKSRYEKTAQKTELKSTQQAESNSTNEVDFKESALGEISFKENKKDLRVAEKNEIADVKEAMGDEETKDAVLIEEILKGIFAQ